MKHEEKPVKITIERPTGPRLTIAEPQSLGQIAVAKSSKVSRSVISGAVVGVSAGLAFLGRHKFATGLGFSAISGVAIHFLVAMTMMGMIGDKAPTVTPPAYTGPGDTFTTSPWGWYSCARAFNASYAASLGAACDVVDSATGLVTCTYHVASNGFVNPSECNGVGQSCASACKVTKAYDQTGNGRDVIQATLGNMPVLAFSSTPSGTLPAITCGTTVGTLQTASNTSLAAPIVSSFVAKRTTFSAGSGLLGTSGAMSIGFGTSASTTNVSGGTPVTQAATDNVWHALQGLVAASTGGAINTDGTDLPGQTTGTNGIGLNAFRFCRVTGTGDIDLVAEGGIWATTTTATDRNNICKNQASSTNGYNFAFGC